MILFKVLGGFFTLASEISWFCLVLYVPTIVFQAVL